MSGAVGFQQFSWIAHYQGKQKEASESDLGGQNSTPPAVIGHRLWYKVYSHNYSLKTVQTGDLSNFRVDLAGKKKKCIVV